MKSLPLVLAAASVVVLSGCMSTRGTQTVYTRSQINQAYRVELGTVLGVREVVIDGESTQVGLYGGAAIGGVGGSQIGSGAGSALAGAAGAVGGMIVGREVEKALTRQAGLEITVALDDGSTVIIVQERSKGGFEDGDRVRVMVGQGTAVVMH